MLICLNTVFILGETEFTVVLTFIRIIVSYTGTLMRLVFVHVLLFLFECYKLGITLRSFLLVVVEIKRTLKVPNTGFCNIIEILIGLPLYFLVLFDFTLSNRNSVINFLVSLEFFDLLCLVLSQRLIIFIVFNNFVELVVIFCSRILDFLVGVLHSINIFLILDSD